MVNTKTMGHVFKHPKYYEELRKLRKEEEAKALSDQASSVKRQATSGPERQATSAKHQATSVKRQACIKIF
jgi:hypothetical protein